MYSNLIERAVLGLLRESKGRAVQGRLGAFKAIGIDG